MWPFIVVSAEATLARGFNVDATDNMRISTGSGTQLHFWNVSRLDSGLLGVPLLGVELQVCFDGLCVRVTPQGVPGCFTEVQFLWTRVLFGTGYCRGWPDLLSL